MSFSVTLSMIGKNDQKSENGIEMSCKYMVKGLKYIFVIIKCIIKDYLELKK